jgi:hypothetical protein
MEALGWRSVSPAQNLASTIRERIAKPLLRAAESGARLKLAALVASSADRGTLALLDEWGLFESVCAPGVELPGEADLVLVEGSVDVRHGLALLKGARLSGWHPGVVCEKYAEAA